MIWRGKDQQDWSDLVVHASPLYIQEKVHPKVLIDDLLLQTKADRPKQSEQLDLFADFNGMAEGIDKTEFYKHDADRWLEIFKKVRDDMPVALGDLAREFRALLGDNHEQGHPADPRTSGG